MKINYGYKVCDFVDIEAFGVSLQVGGQVPGYMMRAAIKFLKGLSSENANAENVWVPDEMR